MSRKFVDPTGQKFGHWLVVASRGRDCSRHDLWLCRCDCCGEERVVRGDTLRHGRSTSCGYLSRKELGQKLGKRRTTHGLSRSRAYICHQSLLQRCFNPNNPSYPDYGGRGITAKYYRNFENFYADMGDPSPGLSLNRIDNDGNYEPGNCEWASPSVQVANRRPRPINLVSLRERLAFGGRIRPRERDFILDCIDACMPPDDGCALPPF